MSISDEPEVLANSLPTRDLNRVAPAVIEWVRLNRDALSKFWNEGDTLSVREVVGFVESLKKV